MKSRGDYSIRHGSIATKKANAEVVFGYISLYPLTSKHLHFQSVVLRS